MRTESRCLRQDVLPANQETHFFSLTADTEGKLLGFFYIFIHEGYGFQGIVV
uniref:Uncharacterized protein n=1 Tax=Anguilla anguilla TaxID=7936 RepID=A0A0E9RIK1_ANGAN